MSDQVQELLERVYNEGVTKANDEALKIIEAARKQAEDIIAEADKNANHVLVSAQKSADELKKNTNSDLKMAAQQTLSVVKKKVTDLLLDKAFDSKAKEAFSDPEYVKGLIKETLQIWKNSIQDGSLVISEKLMQSLDDTFITSLKTILEGKLEVDMSPTMKEGFILAPLDGTYKLSFTDEDFANLFKSYLRPRTNQILFSD